MAPHEYREKWIPGLRLTAHPGMTKSERALSRNRHTLAFSPRIPRELIKIPALTSKGAGNAGGSNTPQLVRKQKSVRA